MPKDYFEDIPASGTTRKESATSGSSVAPKPQEARPVPIRETSSDRSIRNIPSPRARVRVSQPVVETKQWKTPDVSKTVEHYSRWWIWIAAGVTLLVFFGVLIFAFRPTVVTITPRSHVVVFDVLERFTAYPEASAPAGGLAYTTEIREFEDSAAVASDGIEKVSEKAHGFITVVNEYSSSPVRLIKNTRFQTTAGLVFRVPNTVSVPGKKGTSGGVIEVEVYADQPGSEYNIGPTSRFTLPGLKSTADMYSKVYARSSTSFSGGFVGERPKVDQKTLENARAEVRSRLGERASDALSMQEETLVLSGLMNVVFSSLPQTTEANGGVRIHEKAVATFPVFSSGSFAKTIAGDVMSELDEVKAHFLAGETFSATADAKVLQTLGKGPFTFKLQGDGVITFEVDAEGLQSALAGRDKALFESIVASFAGIQTARAKVGPFWSKTFPDDPSLIKIILEREQ